MHLLLPLASSVLYVLAALFLKQAATQGVDPWRTGLACNGVTALLFLCLWPLGGEVPALAQFYQPVLVGLLFVVAQLFTFLALQKGDVSVVTPVLGSKVILVALFTVVFLAEGVRLALWIAAACSSLGVVYLHRTGSSVHPHVGRTIGLALLAAAGYALFDVLIMKWAPAWGAGRFLPIALLFAGLFSLGVLPLVRPRPAGGSQAGGRPLLLGAFFIALQALILVYGLALFGDATAMNVIYSLRGLWSVLAVWGLGHWFANRERELGATAMKTRLVGAALLCAAVGLVLF